MCVEGGGVGGGVVIFTLQVLKYMWPNEISLGNEWKIESNLQSIKRGASDEFIV